MKEEREGGKKGRFYVWSMCVGQVGKPGQFGEANFLPTQNLPKLALRLCCKNMASDFSARNIIGMSGVPDLTNVFVLALFLNTNI